MTLGRHRGRLIAARAARVGAGASGPSQSGKTTGLVVPALLEWAGPVLSTSIKSDVVHDTQGARGKGGGAGLRPDGLHGPCRTRRGRRVAAAHHWEGARRTAARLLGVGDQGAARQPDEAFWRPAGARYLAPLLLAAAHGELTMREVLRGSRRIEENSRASCSSAARTPARSPALEALRVGVGGRRALSLSLAADDRDRP